jgi:hypothetical protein
MEGDIISKCSEGSESYPCLSQLFPLYTPSMILPISLRFERELEALRRELAASQSSQSSTNGSGTPLHSLPGSPRPATKDGEIFTVLAEAEDDTTTSTSNHVTLVREDSISFTSGASQSEGSPEGGIFIGTSVIEVDGLQLENAVMDRALDNKSKSE